MALNSSALESLIVANLNAAGIITSGDHAQAQVMAKAIADAVVEHITADAQVVVSGGSSAGTYKVI